MGHRKSHRKGRSTHRRRKGHKGRRSTQRGGGFSFTGPAFDPAKGLVPIESRTFYDDCANQIGGGCNGGCPGSYPPMQRGGGGGTGGYTIDVTSNALGKVHDGYIVAPCPQRGGADPVSSYPVGYGFGPQGAVETPSGSAHYLDPLPYGQQCMGGGARSRRRHRKGRRSTSRKGRKGSRSAHRKGRKHH